MRIVRPKLGNTEMNYYASAILENLSFESLSSGRLSINENVRSLKCQNIGMFRRTKEFCQDRLNDMLLRSSDGVGEESKDYRNSELRQYWMPDAYSLECYDCNLRFNTFRRKHHCRVCGQIFCSSCSSEYIDGKSLGFNGKLRVCKFCYDFFHRFLKGLEPGASPRLLEKQPSRESTPSSSLNQSAFYSVGSPFIEEDYHNQYLDTIQFSLKDPAQLGRLWAQIIDSESGVILCTVEGGFSGQDLIKWLTSRGESMGPEQAVAIGQALLEANYMTDDFGNREFQNSGTLYRSTQDSFFNVEDNLNANSNVSETDCPEWLQNIPVSMPEEENDFNERKISSTNSNVSNDISVSGKLLSASVLDNITLSNVQNKDLHGGSFLSTYPHEGDNAHPCSLDLIYSKHIRSTLKYLMAEERLNPECTPILSSIDSIPNQPELGSCESYKVQSFVINKDYISPDYVILESQSKQELGCTIILRGASKNTLNKVKRLIKQIALFINNKLYEKSFLENEFVRYDSTLNSHNFPANHLTMSPFIYFLKNDDVKELDVWEYDEDEVLVEVESNTKGSVVKNSNLNLIQAPEEKWEDLLANFRAGVSDRPLIDANVGPKIYDFGSKYIKSIAPSYYSNPKPLPVLFSSYSPRSKVFPSYCISPCTVDINYYGVNDLPLGFFLETFCFAETSFCPSKGCNASVKDHIRRFCLDDGVINLYIQSLENPIHQNAEVEPTNKYPPIVTWKYCVECEKLGPVVELTECSWNYSLGMFLTLLIYEDKLVGGGSKHVCSHSLHQQHYTCFSPLPPNKIEIHPYFPSINSMTVDVRELATNGTLLFSKIHEKLNDLETKEMTNNLCDKYKELNNKYEDNYKEFRNTIDKIKSLIEKLENPEVDEKDKEKHSLSVCRHITGMKNKVCPTKKKKEDKSIDRTRSLSGNNSSSDHMDDISNKLVGDDGTGYSSTPSRLWQNFSSNNSDVLLPNLFPSHIHYSLHSPNYIVIDEKQPSSIVAHVLSTGDYLEERNKKLSKSFSNGGSMHYVWELSEKYYAQFYCNSYFAWEFEKLRNEVLMNPQGLCSVPCRDDRFILKEMSNVEFNCFQEFAPQYFEYIHNSLNPKEKKPSALAKILGIYKIASKNSHTKETHKMDFLVIENVFYGRNIVEKYDLKGSVRNRLVDTTTPAEGGNLVLMDENLLKISCDRPIFIRKSCQEKLLHAIDRDTTFLQNAMIMDYSLLVGIDSDRQELVIGIIDYIRNFSWDKKLENLIKKSGLLGGKPGTTPTIIPPKIYKKRFIEAMLKYFIVLPEILEP
ncbi:PIKFYVE [Lepeophtheirus salmonis]|uniref:PIKFYVE n=1 Tax=Lepeophtheirus salmonis TaxID=72036 RepID=A0A7R8D560_LEPSM|nr:PIKFYVE [Lepeophtheirus salmonis]CAF3001776.1 PIKFYVE [Lepeophtheirus salmonis]